MFGEYKLFQIIALIEQNYDRLIVDSIIEFLRSIMKMACVLLKI